MAQYSNTVSFQAPSDFGVETQANDRQRKLAEAMMMRSMQPQAAGQMVGNQYVPKSWTESLAGALQGPMSMYMQSQADEKGKDIATRQREAYAKELTDFAKLSQGTPAQPEAAGNNPSAYQPPQAATPGNRQAALAMALGAQKRDVLWLVLGRGLRLILVGALLGFGGALATARLLAAAIPELPARDPMAIAVITSVLIAVALVACWVPARRAAKVDPMEALRYE